MMRDPVRVHSIEPRGWIVEWNGRFCPVRNRFNRGVNEPSFADRTPYSPVLEKAASTVLAMICRHFFS